jgi:hypothetical protein
MILNDHPDIRKELMTVDLTIRVRLKGFPQFIVVISEGQISIQEGEPINQPDMIIAASKRPSATSFFTLVKMMFTGDLKVKGLLSNLIKIYTCY